MESKRQKISVIIPIFNEGKNIAQLLDELKTTLTDLKFDYEVIFVNDGSTDNSLDVLRQAAAVDRSIKVISFGRNFGQTAALVGGKDCASGDIVVFMDGDLQNDPRDILSLVEKIQEGYDVVSGWRKDRKDSFFRRRLPSCIANKIISWVSGVRLRDYGCTLKAYRLHVLKDIKLYGEMHRFIPIYAAQIGAKITEVPVNHRPRMFGRSKYGIGRAFKVLLDLSTVKFIYTYQTKPIYVFGGAGTVLFFLSFLVVLVLIYNKFCHGISMIQSPLLLLSALFVIVGVQLILIGLLAEMQMRTYFESSHRPTYYVKEKINV